MTRLEGKTALVTGAGAGIGLAVATRFVAEGARVIIADRDETAARAAADGIGGSARACAVDISSEEQVAAAFAELAASGWSPDVVVANAGVQLFGQDAKAADLDLDVWRRTLDINLTGTFLTVK
ncbi:MAG: SDR family NAD(P)-dependent oxidoreductase, partial [Microbacterium sp.]